MHAKNLIGFTLILMYLGTSTLVFAEATVTREEENSIHELSTFELIKQRRKQMRLDEEDEDDEEEEWEENHLNRSG